MPAAASPEANAPVDSPSDTNLVGPAMTDGGSGSDLALVLLQGAQHTARLQQSRPVGRSGAEAALLAATGFCCSLGSGCTAALVAASPACTMRGSGRGLELPTGGAGTIQRAEQMLVTEHSLSAGTTWQPAEQYLLQQKGGTHQGLPDGGYWGGLSMFESITNRYTARQASGRTVSVCTAASVRQQRDGVHLAGHEEGGCRAVAVALQSPDPPHHLALLHLPQAPLVWDGSRGPGRTSRAALQGQRQRVQA